MSQAGTERALGWGSAAKPLPGICFVPYCTRALLTWHLPQGALSRVLRAPQAS